MTQKLRAYSVLSILETKDAADGSRRTFKGIATTPTVDRMGDIVEPLGAEFTLPIPFLWQHDSHDPIGWITSAKAHKGGIDIEGEVASVDGPQVLKDRLDMAWGYLKNKLVRGLSIGFQPLEAADIEGSRWAQRFIKWSWLELSAVTIPANAEASLTAIKSADLLSHRRPASGARGGVKGVVRLESLPGVSGRIKSTETPTKGQTIMNTRTTEQLLAFDARRKSAVERMETLMNLAADEGRTLDEAENEQYDEAAAELKKIDEHVARLKAHEATMISRAAPITPTSGHPDGSAAAVPGAGSISVVRNLPKGTAFTRYAMSLAASKGNLWQAEKIAAQWKDTPEVGLVLRAAADAGSTSDVSWAAPLVQYQDMVGEFIELLRNATILGKLNALKRAPFNARIPRQTAGSTGSFVGEGLPTPVRELATDSITMPWAKASSIIVITAELARLSQPSAEALVRSDLVSGISEFLDKRLVDPVFAGVANVSPASLTNGVTPRAASGATLAAIDADVAYVMQQFAAANLGLSSGAWIMSPVLAITLSMMRNAYDQPAFPGLSMNGGTFYGLPAIVSNGVAPTGSPGDQHLILVNQNEVYLADDGQMMIDASMEASLQMDDAPASGAQTLVSLWQNGLMGVKVDRWIYWIKRRAQAVQYIDGAQRYGS